MESILAAIIGFSIGIFGMPEDSQPIQDQELSEQELLASISKTIEETIRLGPLKESCDCKEFYQANIRISRVGIQISLDKSTGNKFNDKELLEKIEYGIKIYMNDIMRIYAEYDVINITAPIVIQDEFA